MIIRSISKAGRMVGVCPNVVIPEGHFADEDTEAAVFQATVLEVSEMGYLVEPVEGSAERKSANQIMVLLTNPRIIYQCQASEM